MNDRQLKTFLVLSENGSFTKSEKELYISKQAIKKQMDALEEEIGVQLFTRSHAGLKLTPAGLVFLDKAEEILTQMEQVIRACRDAEQGQPLRILVPNHPKLLLEKPIEVYAQKMPKVQIALQVEFSGNPFDLVRNGKADLAEVAYPGKNLDPELNYTPLVDLPYVVLMAPNHPLSKHSVIELEDLCGSTVTVNRFEWRKDVLVYLESVKDIHLCEYPETNELQASFNVCYQGGLYVTASYYAQFLAPLQCKRLQIPLTHQLGLICRKDAAQPVKAFLNTAQSVYESYVYFEDV